MVCSPISAEWCIIFDISSFPSWWIERGGPTLEPTRFLLNTAWLLYLWLCKGYCICWTNWHSAGFATLNCGSNGSSAADHSVDWAWKSWHFKSWEWSPYIVILICNHHLTNVSCCHFYFQSFVRNQCNIALDWFICQTWYVCDSVFLPALLSLLCINKYYITKPWSSFSDTLYLAQ